MKLNWGKIREEYENGDTNPDSLAEKFGCKRGTIIEKIKTEKWMDCFEEGRKKRIKIFKAIQESALKGIEKADSMLGDCGSLKDVEVHSKTVKAYRDVGLTKPEEIIGKVETNSALDDLYDFSCEDARRVMEDDEA